MNKLKTFFYAFKRSLTDPSYYNDILKAPFSFSVKYLIFLIFIVTMVQSLLFSTFIFSALPKVPEFTRKLKERVRTAYPDELVVTVKDGVVSTNVQEPYYIDIPELSQIDSEEKNYEHLITIDTKGAVENYNDYKTVILVTKKAVVYPDRNSDSSLSSYRVSSLDEIEEDFTIDKQKYDKVVAEILPYADYIPAILTGLAIAAIIIFPLIGTWFVVLWKMFYLLIVGLLIWVIALIFKTNLTYKQTYQLGMHGLTLPIVVTTILGLFSIDIPFLYTIGFMLWMVIVLSKVKSSHPLHPVATHTG